MVTLVEAQLRRNCKYEENLVEKICLIERSSVNLALQRRSVGISLVSTLEECHRSFLIWKPLETLQATEHDREHLGMGTTNCHFENQ